MKTNMNNVEISKVDKSNNIYQILVTDHYDIYNDCLGIYAKVDGNDCTITDDGYTDFNLSCIGKARNEGTANIEVKGKLSDLDELIQKEVNLIEETYHREMKQ